MKDLKVNNELVKALFFDYGDDCDKQYNARASVADFALEAQKYDHYSKQARAENVGIYNLHYGPGLDERLDIFPVLAEQSPAPVFVFIHGGYWRAQSKESACLMATALNKQGIALCALEYTLMPEVGLSEIIREVRSAIAFLYHHAPQYGIDPERIFVGGSSAGGHLSTMLAAEGWPQRYALKDDVIKGVLSLSGLYDVAPLCYTHINEWLRRHPDYTSQVSPLWNLPRQDILMHLAVGELEPLGFKKQMACYKAFCEEKGLRVTAETVPGRNHFDILLDLADVNSSLSQALKYMVFSR